MRHIVFHRVMSRSYETCPRMRHSRLNALCDDGASIARGGADDER